MDEDDESHTIFELQMHAHGLFNFLIDFLVEIETEKFYPMKIIEINHF